MSERKREYDRGYSEAIKAVLLILDLGIETYPRVPTEVTMRRIMDPLTAIEILEGLQRFQDRIGLAITERVEAAAK